GSWWPIFRCARSASTHGDRSRRLSAPRVVSFRTARRLEVGVDASGGERADLGSARASRQTGAAPRPSCTWAPPLRQYTNPPGPAPGLERGGPPGARLGDRPRLGPRYQTQGDGTIGTRDYAFHVERRHTLTHHGNRHGARREVLTARRQETRTVKGVASRL